MSQRDDDTSEFRQAVGKVRRVRTRRAETRPAPAPPEPKMRRRDEARVMDDLAAGRGHEPDLDSGDELLWHQPGLQKRILVRLRRGHFRVQDELDLHQMNTDAAGRSIRLFLDESEARGFRCIKIIHGKGLRSGPGGPRLKRLTARLLIRDRRVLAFAPASPGDGGNGAVYALLGRPG